MMNPLSRKILEIDRDAGGESVWLAYGNLEIPNLFRMIGVRAVNGVHGVPQLDLWERIDPEGQQRDIYNRYAHVIATLPNRGKARFRYAHSDAFLVALGPKEEEELGRLEVTHLLVDMTRPQLTRRFGRFQPLTRVEHYLLYALPLTPRTQDLPASLTIPSSTANPRRPVVPPAQLPADDTTPQP